MSTRFSLRRPDGQATAITGPFRIGRDPECQIQVDSDLVSRIHASIWIDQDHLLLRDERSRNGTLLNGRTLAPGEAHYLHHGDQVRIGETTLTVESDLSGSGPGQNGGLPGQAGAEFEPPATARLERSAPAAAGAAAPSAHSTPGLQPSARRSQAVPLAIGGCLALALLSACCALGLFAATAGRPLLLTALAPPMRRTVTPIPASAALSPRPPKLQPAAEPVQPDNIAPDVELIQWRRVHPKGLCEADP